MDPALLAGVDDTDDEDTSFAGVHDKDTSFAGVPVPNTTLATNADDNSDADSVHKSIDPKVVTPQMHLSRLMWKRRTKMEIKPS